MSARLATLAAIILVTAAACGNAQTPTHAPSASPGDVPAPSGSPSTTPVPTAAPATLILKVTSEGGFINPSANLAALPTVAVYADGRILTPGEVSAIEPGPLLPSVQVRDVGAAGAAAILAAIAKAGLDKPASGAPGIPGDTGTDVFTVVVDGTTTTTRVAGGGPPGPRPGPSAGGDQRAAALELLGRLLDPAETWGGPAAAATTYAPTAYRVYVAPGGPPADPSASQSPVAWPLATPLDAFGTPAVPDRGIAGLRQGVVLGSDAALLAPVVRIATTLTPFTSGGRSYTLAVRPLLPDELGG